MHTKVSKNRILRHKKKGDKWIGRPSGNSGSLDDDKRYKDWYKF